MGDLYMAFPADAKKARLTNEGRPEVKGSFKVVQAAKAACADIAICHSPLSLHFAKDVRTGLISFSPACYASMWSTSTAAFC